MNLTKPQKLMSAGRAAEAMTMLPDPGSTSDPRVEIIRARAQAETGDVSSAIMTLDNAQNRYPAHAPTLLFEGIYHWDAGQIAESRSCFDSVLAAQPGNDLARSYLALNLFAAGDFAQAAEIWRSHGFSDNVMFRIRSAEHIEKCWLRDRSFMGEIPSGESTSPPKAVMRKALKNFYKRDFTAMLQYLPPAPANDELVGFLAATAHEMLGQYSAAETYIRHFDDRRIEWPDPLVAINARLLTRRGHIREAASEFSKVLIVGPEDFGVNYYLAIICLAYEKTAEARQYFLRAFTSYMVDTQEFQWWQLEQVLLGKRQHISGATNTSRSPAD